jgi:hypothetical protein
MRFLVSVGRGANLRNLVFLLLIGGVVWAALVTHTAAKSPPIGSGVLEKWLLQHPEIERSLIWDQGDDPRSWRFWGQADRSLLEKYFESAVDILANQAHRAKAQEGDLEIPDPIPNQKILLDKEIAKTVYAPEMAKRLFFASVAQSLALEVNHSLGWSILESPKSELAVLFDSRTYFSWDAKEGGYSLNEDRGGLASFSSPRLVYEFLRTHGLIKSSSHDTILSVLTWARDLWHDIAPSSIIEQGFSRETAYYLDHFWHYRGFPPSLRVLQGTRQTLVPDEPDVHHWTAGCWGTTGFFIQIFRTLNIGVELKSIEGHALPHFIADGTFLSHGDDPYNRWIIGLARSDIGALLIPDQEWPEFERGGLNSVGSQPARIAVEKLLPTLVTLYCDDLKRGLSPAQGSVFAQLRDYFSFDQLKKKNLWERLAHARHRCL